KDTRVIYSIYLTHRDPAHWTDPETFNPERFAPGAAEERTPFAYIPFGAGKRNCIGSFYGMTECKAVVSRILQRFQLEIDASRVKPHMAAALEPSPALPARVLRHV
ncbi:MAG: cytochrome P450, partial [Elusimicrobia bacterium]|nr:cytochrome P450 [Elusimicrobiota bacterium]